MASHLKKWIAREKEGLLLPLIIPFFHLEALLNASLEKKKKKSLKTLMLVCFLYALQFLKDFSKDDEGQDPC